MSTNPTHRSHFSQLLSAFRVSGTELADILHIDSSLVSKWKNNKRSLKGNSPMLNSIADYFISLDVYSNYATLKALLNPDCQDVALDTPDHLRSALKRWLISSVDASSDTLSLHDFLNRTKRGHEYTHLQFRGNEGKREAILGLLRTALSLQPGQELWCLMQDTQRWFVEDESYTEIWEKVNLEFLSCGNTIRIIHTIDRHYDMLARSLLAWLPLYLTGRVTPYFSSARNTAFSVCRSILLLKDKMLLYQLSPADDSIESTMLAFSNETILKEAWQMLQPSFDYATPLFQFYYRNDHYKYTHFLSQMVNLDEDQYVFMRFPFVNVISTVQLRQILEENGVNEEIRERTLQACIALKTDARKNTGRHFRYLIPKSQLEALLAQDKIMLDVVSFFSGRPLYISNAIFRSLLRKLTHLLTCESHKSIHEITLLEDVHAKRLRNLNMFVKKNTCISIFNKPEQYRSEEEPLLLTTTESSIIHSLYMFCDQVWNHTLPQKREKTYVARQLQIMLETILPPPHVI